mmetsp:Transcript_26516/g.79086  ORF Transcript_26516/g.79086 Transcript_26516/m.79086 type:complete len:207 (-) Transcript_26516:820-1440(-)
MFTSGKSSQITHLSSFGAKTVMSMMTRPIMNHRRPTATAYRRSTIIVRETILFRSLSASTTFCGSLCSPGFSAPFSGTGSFSWTCIWAALRFPRIRLARWSALSTLFFAALGAARFIFSFFSGSLDISFICLRFFIRSRLTCASLAGMSTQSSMWMPRYLQQYHFAPSPAGWTQVSTAAPKQARVTLGRSVRVSSAMVFHLRSSSM